MDDEIDGGYLLRVGKQASKVGWMWVNGEWRMVNCEWMHPWIQ